MKEAAEGIVENFGTRQYDCSCMKYFADQDVVLFKGSLIIVPKSWVYCSILNVSCLKYDTALRFSLSGK